jgi:hypothetical protein
MNKPLLLLTIALLLLNEMIVAQPKKLVAIPSSEKTGGNHFCICSIVTYSSEQNSDRTDAIFAGRPSGSRIPKKQLLRDIRYEMQQAMVFFDSYKVIRRYGSPVDCNTLYKYMKEKYSDGINRYTVLSPGYAVR